MGTPTEIIYARTPANLQIGARLQLLQSQHEGWRKPSLGALVGELLDKVLPPIVPPKPERKKPAKRAAKGKRGRR